jgi:hypothetical protein
MRTCKSSAPVKPLLPSWSCGFKRYRGCRSLIWSFGVVAQYTPIATFASCICIIISHTFTPTLAIIVFFEACTEIRTNV